MKNCLSLILLFLSFSTPLYADAAPRIKGKLVEAGSRQPIDFADIYLLAGESAVPAYRSFPESNGQFVILDVRDGTYTLLVRLLGFDVYTLPGLVLNASTPQLDLGTIEMKPLEVGLAEVEVVAHKKQIIYKLDKKIIDASGNLLAGGGSAVDILEHTPSIRVDAEGEVSFRGSSGFAVYVDGKPSVFSGSQALQQIPAGQIENIEIITTPSARHDTGGDVGIIHIITRKDAKPGLSGMVNLSGSTLLSRAADFLLSHQANRSRWHFGGNWTERMLKSQFEQDKTTLVNGWETHSHSTGPRSSNNFNYSLKAGWQYDLLTTTSLTADLEGGYGGRIRQGDLRYSEEHPGLERADYFSRDYYHIDETYLQGSLGANHRFNDNGHQLSTLFYLKYGGDALEYFQSDLFDALVTPSLLKKAGNAYADEHRQMGHRAYEDEYRWTVRANIDYAYPYNASGRLEAGYQYYSYLEDGDYSMEFWLPDEKRFEFRTDDAIYNNFFYFQNGIHSLYALLADAYRSFTYQIGLRGEHTHRVLRTDVAGANRTYNNFHLFPSVHIGVNLPHEQQLLASYSRRITRPDLFYMEPYITYRDFYSAEIGNPDIGNEFINSFELNYKKNIGASTLSVTAFHRSRAGKIERLRIPYESAIRPGVTLDSMANVGNDYSSGLELNGQIQASRRWNLGINGSLYHYRVVNKLLRDARNASSANYDITLHNALDAGRYTRIQIDGNFVGPSVTTQGRTKAYWYVNLAIRQQFLNRRLSASLSMRDVFNSARYVSHISTADLQSLTKIRPSYPLITLTLNYTFNNFKAKSTPPREDRDLFEGSKH
ncbi:MAG: TonB-dependent receptor [Tannerellaceae bacterium]|nr:TonB-dependent receptor [Tannerellaceae bacterium]